MKYNPAVLPSGMTESNLYIAYWDSSKWTAISSTIDSQAKTVTAQISHFSIYAILGTVGNAAPPKPASFAISDLKITPTSVRAGETVTIVAAVTNNGGSQGSYDVILKLNGVVEVEDEITLGAGETGVVTFTVTKDKAGSYKATIDNKSTSFTVGTQETEQFNSSWLLIGAIAIGILLIMILIVVIARRRA